MPTTVRIRPGRRNGHGPSRFCRGAREEQAARQAGAKDHRSSRQRERPRQAQVSDASGLNGERQVIPPTPIEAARHKITGAHFPKIRQCGKLEINAPTVPQRNDSRPYSAVS